VEIYSVPAKGVGRPDYTPTVVSSKPVVVANQKKWALLVTKDNLVPGSETIVIPAADLGNINGWQLNMGGGVITCRASCLQRVIMSHTPGFLGTFIYDVRGDIFFGPLSSTIINPDEDLTIILYNDDSVARSFSISLMGLLEKIA